MTRPADPRTLPFCEEMRRIRLSPYRRGMGPTATLVLYDIGNDGVDWTQPGRTHVGYRFIVDGVTLFEGTDYSPSPLHSIDGDDAVRGLLGFLCLKPGDTDAEYFERHNYGPAQLEWAEQHGETFSMEADHRFGDDR